MPCVVKRGEIYFADLNPVLGSEQSGVRPVLIIQNDVGNYYSPTVVVAAISGQPKRENLPTHYSLPKANGLDVPSIVLLEQIRTLDKMRLGEYVGQLNKTEMKGIDRCIAVSMGL
jgi:mRNA interferase MazF